MFTGLVEETGMISRISPIGQGLRFTVAAAKVLDDLQMDDSISINGCCLTVVSRTEKNFDVEAVEHTLQKTNLNHLKANSEVNLERAVRLADRLGGHLVQGHVDGIATVEAIEKRSTSWWVSLAIPQEFSGYVIPAGSVTLDGISFTAAEIDGTKVSISVIPHTWQVTAIKNWSVGHAVNLETDMIAKYIHRLMPGGHVNEVRVTEDWLLNKETR